MLPECGELMFDSLIVLHEESKVSDHCEEAGALLFPVVETLRLRLPAPMFVEEMDCTTAK
jgi:hypothetical protein